jgi:hypothetical protein
MLMTLLRPWLIFSIRRILRLWNHLRRNLRRAEEKPEEKPADEKTVDEFLASDPSEEERRTPKKPSKKTAADPYESTYPIEDVLKEELLKGKSPFPQLGVRYPGYRVQFNYSAPRLHEAR